MKIKICNFKAMKNGCYIFSLGIDDLIWINGFRLIKQKGGFFLSVPQVKKGLGFDNTVMVLKPLKDEIYNASMIRLNEYKKISLKDRLDIEVSPF